MGSNKKRTFCCPVDEDVYFIPKCDCFVDTPKYPSATGCLSRTETEELEKCIEEANELLLSLGLSGELGKIQSTYLALKDKLGANIHLDLDCDKQKEIKGVIILVGRDFLVLENEEGTVIVAYQHIDNLSVSNRRSAHTWHYDNPSDELLKDPHLRRRLVLNFGAVVSQSPALIQEFYGLTLPVLLLTYCNHQVTIYMGDEQVSGVITDVYSDTIKIQYKKTYEMLPITNICKIEVKN